jgi:hypothetical protein
MPIDRFLGRNVQFYDATSPEVPLGGIIQNGSITENNFLDMLGILLISQTPLRVQERTSGHVVTTTDNPLKPGDYLMMFIAKVGARQVGVQLLANFKIRPYSGHWMTSRNDLY